MGSYNPPFLAYQPVRVRRGECHKRQDRSMIKKTYHVSGNEKIGYRLIIPMEAYKVAMQPQRYTCAVTQDGILVYQPVHP